MTHANLEYIESLYLQYKQNPASLSTDWKYFFDGVEFAQDGSLGLSEKELDVYHLITAYRNYGHFEARVNPLMNTYVPSEELALKKFNLTEADLAKKFQIGRIVGKSNATLKEIIEHLRDCYCNTLTVQCSEALPEIRNWFIKEFEHGREQLKYTADQKKSILATLTKTEILEKFIHTRYVGAKRFSIEGGDALIPMLEELVTKATSKGVEEIVIGMAHRGRVNVLSNFMGKAVKYIFADFNGPTETSVPIEDYDGDVKYHMGYQSDRMTPNGSCRLTLGFNPSHLEAINPVVLGMARASQRRRKDTEKRKKVIPLLIHGDAAFAGQGVVLETFQMAYVRGYTVGGTIHIAIDNQVGFTTNPENARSSHYCTDVAKVLATPVLHVNGDDVEACVRAMDIALKYRHEWGKDIVVNLTCYRKFGHNEGDEPAFTQPQMYEIIKKQPTPREIYAKKLTVEGVCDGAYAEKLVNERMDELQKVYEQTKENVPKVEPFKFEGLWKGLRKSKAADFESKTSTRVDLATLQKVGKLIGEVPQGFNIHPKAVKLIETRRAMAEGKELIDWGMGELLAYATLVEEGTSVRLTGQDCTRGTFTHRHSAFFDVRTGEKYSAIKQLAQKKSEKLPPGELVEFCVYDSILSEYGVLGFEYGNSISDPTFLTLWEAQFGDFSNGAQIIIDQFLTAGESKWQQMSGLVLLLPHGYEGQGPEHSSARLERFLQMSAQYNIQVANLTTPAQIFHALRRQVKRDFRKPLVIMSPKSLLRHPKAVSKLEDLSLGEFQEVIPDTLDVKSVETVTFVSGKLYYELLEEREKQKSTRTALVRVEQLYPTPLKQMMETLKKYPKLKSVVWAQEEPRNMGGFSHIYFKLMDAMRAEGLKMDLQYVGRGERSSPATGSIYRHKVEQQEIIRKVFEV